MSKIILGSLVKISEKPDGKLNDRGWHYKTPIHYATIVGKAIIPTSYLLLLMEEMGWSLVQFPEREVLIAEPYKSLIHKIEHRLWIATDAALITVVEAEVKQGSVETCACGNQVEKAFVDPSAIINGVFTCAGCRLHRKMWG